MSVLLADTIPSLGNCLTKESHDMLEDHFCQPVPVLVIYHGKGSRRLTEYMHVLGVTLGRHIFLHPSQVTKDGLIDSRLIVHETAHVIQYKRLGYIPFLWEYARNARRVGYMRNPFEVMARLEENDFISGEYPKTCRLERREDGNKKSEVSVYPVRNRKAKSP